MICHPCAKINLGLNVVARRSDGYHDLETVFYPVYLRDRLEITSSPGTPSGCKIEVDGIDIDAAPDDNLVSKAYWAVERLCPGLPGITAKLTKQIPSQAGMGGGSSDCAFTIKMLNDIFGLHLEPEVMRRIAASLGADCAFFIDPTPSFATGIGDRLVPVDVNLHLYYIGIVKPKLMISTKEAFANIAPRRPAVCCKDIVTRPVNEWKGILLNDFEQSIACVHPEIAELKERLYALKAEYAAMSGSGSALFGIFKEVPDGFDSAFPDCFTYITKG